MASSSGTSSGCTVLQNSGSDGDLQALMEQRKRKRMIFNRESARRSRMRKQKHQDDLMSQVGQLRNENNQMITKLNQTTQQSLNIEAENCVLRAQVEELSHRLQSLNEIISLMNSNNRVYLEGDDFNQPVLNPWNLPYLNQQPVMASAEMYHHQY